MTRLIKTGTTVVDQFPAIDMDGYTKKSGLTAFTTTVWKDAVVRAIVPVITEIGASGEYRVETPIPDGEDGFWKVEVFIDYSKDIQVFEYVAGTWSMTDVYAAIKRLLGLSHENIFIDNTIYDANGQLVSARVRIFDTKVNCDAATDGGSETVGLVAKPYTITTTWDVINEFKIFKQVLEP